MNEVDNLVTLVLFQSVEFKTYQSILSQSVLWKIRQGSDHGQSTSEMWRAPFLGLLVILYLRTGTDSAHPIRVVRDSYVKG